jgi:O-antigen ligase
MLFGTSPEYIGLVSWIAFIVLGILFSDRLNDFLTTKTTLLLSLLIGGLSFATSIYEVFHGLRIPGLMLQATTMGMYAVCLGIIGLWQLRLATTKRRQLSAGVLIALSTAIVIFTQSRIAVMAYVLSFGILAIWMTWANKKQRMLSLLVVALVMTVSLLPHVFTGYFARFQADSVGNGTHYRLELYKLTATDVLSDNRIIGYGPGSLPDTINDESKVPEDIQLSLAVGDVFLSSHDMYLDIGYCFGLVATLIILVLSGIAFVRPLLADTIPGMELWCLFLVGIINALFNVTSLELTPWYFLLLFPLLAANKTRRHA